MVMEVTDADNESEAEKSDAKDAEIDNWCAWLDRYLAVVQVSVLRICAK
jgi:hypothetical protein